MIFRCEEQCLSCPQVASVKARVSKAKYDSTRSLETL